MSQLTIREISCEQCGAAIVTIYQRSDGARQLQLRQDLTLVLKARPDSQRAPSSIICSNCGHEMPLRLALFSRYA